MLRLGFTVTCCVEWVVDACNKRRETVYLRTPNYYGVLKIILFHHTYDIWPVVCDGAPTVPITGWVCRSKIPTRLKSELGASGLGFHSHVPLSRRVRKAITAFFTIPIHTAVTYSYIHLSYIQYTPCYLHSLRTLTVLQTTPTRCLEQSTVW